MSATAERAYGLSNMTAPLRRVLVRSPRADDLRFWREYGWRSAPDPADIAREHDALCELLAGAGAEVVLAETPDPGNPDAIYVYDPVLIADNGAILLRPRKEGRGGEPDSRRRRDWSGRPAGRWPSSADPARRSSTSWSNRPRRSWT